VVVPGRRAERRLGSLAAVRAITNTRTSRAPKLTRALPADCPDPHQSQQRESMSGRGYPKFRNGRAVAEIRIGVREFNCVGVSPPHDHPHVYINMGEQDALPCPYCATRFRFDPRLRPSEADPPDSLFLDPDLE
jgi:uncharacterized Zn-finger protein